MDSQRRARTFELPLKINRSNEELLECIAQFDESRYLAALDKYMEKYNSFDDGHASERVVERIKQVVDGTFKKWKKPRHGVGN